MVYAIIVYHISTISPEYMNSMSILRSIVLEKIEIDTTFIRSFSGKSRVSGNRSGQIHMLMIRFESSNFLTFMEIMNEFNEIMYLNYGIPSKVPVIINEYMLKSIKGKIIEDDIEELNGLPIPNRKGIYTIILPDPQEP